MAELQAVADRGGLRGRALAVDALLLLALVAAGTRLVSGLEGALDIGLQDETRYLAQGLRLLEDGPPDPAWAPLYAVWYFLLGRFVSDPVALYYLNFKVTAVLPAVLLFVVLRRFGVTPLPAWGIAFLFLVSRGNVVIWPRVFHFAIAVVLAVLLAGTYIRRPTTYALAAALGAVLAGQVRPELILALPLILGGYAVLLWRARRALDVRAEALRFAGFAAAGLALVLVLGYPLADPENRKMEAMRQHFALNWMDWNGRPMDLTNYAWIFGQNFGADVDGPVEMFRRNPPMFLRHVGTNLATYPERAVRLAEHYPVVAPSRPWEHVENLGAWALFIAYGAYLAVGRRRMPLGARGGRAVLVLGAFLAPSVFSAVLVYPRDSYLFMQAAFVVTGAAVAFARRRPGDAAPLRMDAAAALVAGLMVLAVPQPYHSHTSEHHALKTIRAISALGIRAPVTVLEEDGGYADYLGRNFRRAPVKMPGANFLDQLGARDINMIVVSPRMLGDVRYRGDPQWRTFLADPGRFGFRKMPVPGTPYGLLVRDDLLPGPGGPPAAP